MAVTDERVNARLAKAAAEGGDVAGFEMLVAEYQHRMLGKGAADPGKRVVVELRQIDAKRLGAEVLAKRAQLSRFGGNRHRQSSSGGQSKNNQPCGDKRLGPIEHGWRYRSCCRRHRRSLGRRDQWRRHDRTGPLS